MRRSFDLRLVAAVTLLAAAVPAWADNETKNANCKGLPTASEIKGLLNDAAALAVPPLGGTVGGLFNGTKMWGAVVNRDGEVCAYATSQDDPAQVWPGSQAIAKAKAFTGNAFSLDTLALSSARLYTFTQPGHSLWSLGQSNLFDPLALAPPAGQGGGNHQIVGGLIFFGGGVPLYNAGKIIGGLGVSGDTSCADHEIAKRARHLASLDPPGGPLVDDIVFSSDPAGPSVFDHPKCPNTYRNGTFIGNEKPSSGY